MSKRLVQKLFVISALVLLFSGELIAQDINIRVVNKYSREQLAFANICLENVLTKEKQFVTTNENGFVTVQANGRNIIVISYIGFENLIDTITASENLIFELLPSSYQENEFVVTAQYTPVKADQSIYKVKVIDVNQISEKGANNLSELLATELNIRTSQDNSLGSKMSMQGLSGEHIKLLIDGIPVIVRMDGNIDLSQLNLHNVDHIEIVEGPMSVIYGSNALAGAINIITKESKLARFSTAFDTYYESVGVYNFSGIISGKKKNHIYSISAARNFFGGYSETDSVRSKQWNPKRQYTTDAYYIYDLKKMKFKYSASFFHELLQDKGDLQAPYFENAFDQYFTTIRLANKLDFSAKLKSDRFLNILFSYSSFNRAKQTYFTDLTTLEQNLTSYEFDHDTSLFHAYLLRGTFSKSKKESKFNYQLGYDFNIESGGGKRILNQSQNIGDYAAFLSVKYSPSNLLTFQPGLRYAYNTRYEAPLVHSLNIKWQAAQKLLFRASYARGFRAPSLKELYLYFVDVNHNIIGNENLQAEYAYNFSLSAAYKFSKSKHNFGFETSLFNNIIENIITLAAEDATHYSYINVDHFKTHGGQFNFTYQMHPRFTVKTGFSLTGRYNSFTDENPTLADFTYSKDVSANLRYKNVKYKFFISVYYKYNGKLPQFYLSDNGVISEGYISDYHSMDMSFGRRFVKDKLEVSAGVKNLFDNTNIVGIGSSGGVHTDGGGNTPVAWGRTMFFKLAYVFNTY